MTYCMYIERSRDTEEDAYVPTIIHENSLHELKAENWEGAILECAEFLQTTTEFKGIANWDLFSFNYYMDHAGETGIKAVKIFDVNSITDFDLAAWVKPFFSASKERAKQGSIEYHERKVIELEKSLKENKTRLKELKNES